MKINIITLFPKMFESPFEESIIKRAIKNKIIEIKIHNLRDFATDKYKTVDDKPFGGGVGMLLKVDVMERCLKELKGKKILMSARGETFNQEKAEELSKLKEIVIVCGHYEGTDQRISDYLVDEEISIGNFVTTGGELPAMTMVDSIVRLLPKVLGKDESSCEESFSKSLERKKEYPQYTRPAKYKGWQVPEILLSGDPKKIKEWQLKQCVGNKENRN
jgi:tRNA (guanine37-N1)-methyltransferase